MQIKRVRLSGFKSFVDPADLRIEPGLTGIVGPNGCGKSNLLEALRWAMGENSPRSMRGAGMEDVIFAGTATRPARDFAEVSILLDGAADDGESEVVRRIERGAGSAYRIDGRDVRARDVALLFADAATGAHSPALVSQGRIGAVIAAKPADRRAMLEEAAGIAGLHVRRRDAEQKLRATEANLQRLDELIADQEARAGTLRRQARQAERYRALTERIRTGEARLIYARWRDAAAAAETAKAEAEAAEAQVQATAEVQRAAAAYQAQAAETLAGLRAASLAARDAASEAAHRLATTEAERAQVERRIAELADTARRIVADRDREGALASDAASAIARLNEDAAALTTRIADATKQLPALDAALADAERLGRDVEVALAQALAAQAGEAAEIRIADAAIAAARDRLTRAERERQDLAARRAGLVGNKDLEAERDAAARQRVDASAAREKAEADLAVARSGEAIVRASNEHAQATRAAAKADLAAIGSEIAALERADRATAGERLLDSLSVDPGYEHALAAALGDDADAGLDPTAERHWSGSTLQPDDPSPPAGTTPLAAFVRAPAALARRLSQVFVVDRDDGVPLAVGQRLVTRGGALRRWDGFVATGEGAAAAERLQRANRLTTLRDALPAASVALDNAERAVSAAGAAIDDVTRRIAAAQARAAEGERVERDARQAEDRAVAALERIVAQASDLDAAERRAAVEQAEAQTGVDAANDARGSLSDGTETKRRVADLQRAADARRAATAHARAERLTLDRAIAADRERLGGAQAESKGWRARAGEAARRIADMDARAAQVAAEVEALTGRPAALDRDLGQLRAASERKRAEVEVALAAEREAEGDLRHTEEAARSAGEAFASAREARAGAAARAENQELRRVEMGRLAGERFECPAPVLPEKLGFASGDVGQVPVESAAHERLVLDRERIGPVNLVAERELAELEAGALGNSAEREELGQAVAQLRGSIGTLNREGRQRLLAAFEAVNGHFARLFTTLFNGGQAHLELVDSDDPLEAGLEIMAQPPGKRLQSLTLLSGGEQALTAVALIFGLFLTNPAPICVLDEVDAPLDDANIERFCGLLDRMTQETDTRYLIVTHNAVTMSRMHRLFGVTMIEKGVSRLVSVDLGGAETLLAAE